MFPVAAYFIYLYASGTRSEFPDNAHWWAVADSIMIAIMAVQAADKQRAVVALRGLRALLDDAHRAAG